MHPSVPRFTFVKPTNKKSQEKQKREKEEIKASTDKTIDLNIVESKMKEEIEQLKMSFSKIKVGRLTPEMFEK